MWGVKWQWIKDVKDFNQDYCNWNLDLDNYLIIYRPHESNLYKKVNLDQIYKKGESRRKN